MKTASFLLAALFACAALPAGAAVPPDLQGALDARTAGVPGTGIVVAVIDHGKQSIYMSGSSGNARPLDEHTLFEIGSDTKTFTATTLAGMVLGGQVSLSDPIGKYLPKNVHVPASDGRTITLLDLAEQRSGLPRMPTNMADESSEDPYSAYDVESMYAFLNGYTLTRAPGSKYEYSNYGVALLGQLLANRAKTTYPALVQKRVLDPLGMTETTFATMPASDPGMFATGHDLGGQVMPPWHFESMLPAGGIRSNVVDMLKYLRCNMGQGPLAKECLFAQQPRADGEAAHRIGLVWWTNPTSGTISHGGDTAGFHAEIAISKDRQTGVVVMSNGLPVADVAAHVLANYPIASCRNPPQIAPGDSSPYAGSYCNAGGGFLFAVASGKSANELSIAVVPQSALTYTLTKPGTYLNAVVGAAAAFVEQDGKVVGLRFTQSGETLPAIRLDAQGKPVVAQLPSPFPPIVALGDAILDQYVGTYASAGLTFTVTRNGDQLFVRLTGQPAIPIFASAKDEFFCKIVDAQISFVRDAAGAVKSLTLHQNGVDTKAPRGTPNPI